MEFVDSEDRIDIVTILYLEKAKWDQSVFYERDIRSDTRSTFIDIHKYLKVRYENEDK